VDKKNPIKKQFKKKQGKSLVFNTETKKITKKKKQMISAQRSD